MPRYRRQARREMPSFFIVGWSLVHFMAVGVHTVRAPTARELPALLSRLIKRIMRLLTRKGYLIEEQGMTYLAATSPDTALASLQAAACTYRIALGPRAGQKVLSLQTVPSQEARPMQQCCVSAQGFSLHAEVWLGGLACLTNSLAQWYFSR